ncbi:hypothetical protein ABPG73_004783 [Tetrahymena malaccensis]
MLGKSISLRKLVKSCKKMLFQCNRMNTIFQFRNSFILSLNKQNIHFLISTITDITKNLYFNLKQFDFQSDFILLMEIFHKSAHLIYLLIQFFFFDQLSIATKLFCSLTQFRVIEQIIKLISSNSYLSFTLNIFYFVFITLFGLFFYMLNFLFTCLHYFQYQFPYKNSSQYYSLDIKIVYFWYPLCKLKQNSQFIYYRETTRFNFFNVSISKGHLIFLYFSIIHIIIQIYHF